MMWGVHVVEVWPLEQSCQTSSPKVAVGKMDSILPQPDLVNPSYSKARVPFKSDDTPLKGDGSSPIRPINQPRGLLIRGFKLAMNKVELNPVCLLCCTLLKFRRSPTVKSFEFLCEIAISFLRIQSCIAAMLVALKTMCWLHYSTWIPPNGLMPAMMEGRSTHMQNERRLILSNLSPSFIAHKTRSFSRMVVT